MDERHCGVRWEEGGGDERGHAAEVPGGFGQSEGKGSAVWLLQVQQALPGYLPR